MGLDAAVRSQLSSTEEDKILSVSYSAGKKHLPWDWEENFFYKKKKKEKENKHEVEGYRYHYLVVIAGCL